MSSRSGIYYFTEGFTLIRTKGLKRFVFVPLAINLVLFAAAFYLLFGQISAGIEYLVGFVPDWLGGLKTVLLYFLWPLAVISVLLMFALIFGTLANWIAAPFNGILSEKVERHLTGQSLGDDGLMSLIKDVPRMLKRELAKFIWYLPRAILFLLMFFFLPVIGQVIWFLFSAWMMSIQYCDYPYDNHKVDFKKMRTHLATRKGLVMPFGIMVNIFSLIPIVNFIVMPVAICGATAMWVDELKKDALMSTTQN
ncbi:sulfate transporter CysZ [Alteromonas sp. KUL49]|uniref:sulfate transporter CysZ n=1 Tax=Alteromonas sp. KUL49 TaxID=2480798 RepID=UPI00102EF077|nr:sulfate transporter CysZ [Alteromonas sp. KUL49]TAP35872.1 sulfate transporter CysZ [Alteromonas sp. KUL49]GEA13255.1 sulfate transporter CysZ [Alteromonas sp. KUL49]